MSIVKELKKINDIENEDVKFVLSEVISSIAERWFEPHKLPCSVDMSKRYWGHPWFFRKYKDTGEVVEDYWEEIKTVEKEEGRIGYEKYEKNIEEIYCFNTYNLYVEKLKLVMAELVEMGFDVKIEFDSNPEHASWDDHPKKQYIFVYYKGDVIC